MIRATGIQKKYGDLEVLKGVDIEVSKGEIVSIVGASGAGKTTLLQILGTLDRPDSGEVIIDNQNVTSLNDAGLASFRNRHIGFIFQFHHLLAEFTAIENVMIPSMIAQNDRKASELRATELLGMLGLENRTSHKPSELSGGEQQRVAVARALMMRPAVIFADEPSGNLDSANAKELHELFFKLRDEFQQTFVIVTHNEELADMADRKLEMVDGRIARST
ncbi:MAG: ABC transporter ATP-binding protein [Flavobacteriales bacterium]|nr:ABC transporter ATP-binding protein [Flavobacteriales bacterium]